MFNSLNIAGAQGQYHPQSAMTLLTKSQFTSDGHPARGIPHSPKTLLTVGLFSSKKEKKGGGTTPETSILFKKLLNRSCSKIPGAKTGWKHCRLLQTHRCPTQSSLLFHSGQEIASQILKQNQPVLLTLSFLPTLSSLPPKKKKKKC